jgi:hypothetical protein
MQTLRNWLLGIVKQAIAEDRETAEFHAKYGPATKWTPISASNIAPTITQATVIDTAKSEISRSFNGEPVSFEQLQDAALEDQDAYWKKQMPSDV